MTLATGIEAGPGGLCLAEASNTWPSTKLPVQLTCTVSFGPGRAPVPWVITWYCRPEAVVLTPAAVLFLARKASPSVLFLAPSLTISALYLVWILAMKASLTCLASASLMVGFWPDNAALTALATAVGSSSSRMIGGTWPAICQPTT